MVPLPGIEHRPPGLKQLKNSGFDYKQSREIMICALKGITRKRVVKKHWKIEYRRNYSKQVPGLKRK